MEQVGAAVHRILLFRPEEKVLPLVPLGFEVVRFVRDLRFRISSNGVTLGGIAYVQLCAF